MKRLFYIGILIVALAGLLGACSPTAPANPEGTGANTQPVEESQPTAAEPAEAVAATPTPEGTVSVTGIVARKRSDGNGEIAYSGIRLFLGTLIYSEDGKTALARVNQLESPHARTDENGRFAFYDIPAGTYILAVLVPPNNLVKLNHPETGDQMLIELEEGATIDLGKLYYDLPFGNMFNE